MSKKNKTPKLKLSLETEKLYNTLRNESEMACVLIGTSFISEILGALLRDKFIKGSSTVEKLLSSDSGIVGNYMSRAEITYCLGIIDKEIFCDLKNIAEIRNKFAHSYFKLSFNDDGIKNILDELEYYKNAFGSSFRNKFSNSIKYILEDNSAKNIFNLTITTIISHLMLDILHIEFKELLKMKQN